MRILFGLAPFVGCCVIACGGSTSPTQKPLQALNDTGVGECLSADWVGITCEATGQDGEQGRDAKARDAVLVKIGAGASGFDFTKLNMAGQPLPDTADDWQCVRDNLTQHVWQVKSASASSPHYVNNTYSWYDANPATNGGNAGAQNLGSCVGSQCDTADYIAQMNTAWHWCGLSNWRLPTINELLSIADQSQINPPLDTRYFPYNSLNAHWTSQTVAFNPELAWYVYFTAAGNGNINKSALANIRLVSNGFGGMQ